MLHLLQNLSFSANHSFNADRSFFVVGYSRVEYFTNDFPSLKLAGKSFSKYRIGQMSPLQKCRSNVSSTEMFLKTHKQKHIIHINIQKRHSNKIYMVGPCP